MYLNVFSKFLAKIMFKQCYLLTNWTEQPIIFKEGLN